jgi:hypothetical protein
MTKIYILFAIFLTSSISFAQNAFISEVHVVTGIEVTGPPGENLANYTIDIYSSGFFFGSFLYSSTTLSGTLGPGSNAFYSKNFNNIPNLDGGVFGRVIVLSYNGNAVNAISYGAIFDEPNNVGTVVNIGPKPNSTNGSPDPDSTQYTTTGGWQTGIPASKGEVNTGQTLSVVKNNIEGFKMYPNPVSNGQLNITSNSWADKQVEIYNFNGQQVYNKLIKHREVIDIYNLNKGIYLIRIIEEDKIATRKLVVY